MRSVLEQLAAHLLSVACYDREVFTFVHFSYSHIINFAHAHNVFFFFSLFHHAKNLIYSLG